MKQLFGEAYNIDKVLIGKITFKKKMFDEKKNKIFVGLYLNSLGSIVFFVCHILNTLQITSTGLRKVIPNCGN